MSNRLGGFQGTAYLGTNANQPSNVTFHKDNPTQYDTQNYSLGDQWVNTVDKVIWALVSLAGDATSKGQLATWIQTGGSASTTTYVTDIGSATESGGIINVFGGPNINTSGSAATVEVSMNQNLTGLDSVTMENLIVNNSVDFGFLGEGVLQSDGSGNISASEGTDGQVLISSSSGAPSWANLTAGSNITITNGANSIEIASTGGGGGSGGGSLVFIETKVATSQASLEFTSGIDTTYDNYLLIINRLDTASAPMALQFCILQISIDGGSTYINTGYASQGGGTPTSGFIIAQNGAPGTTQQSNLNFSMYDMTAASNTPMCSFYGTVSNSSTSTGSFAGFGGVYNGSASMNAFKILMTDGSDFSGIFSLYGIAEFGGGGTGSGSGIIGVSNSTLSSTSSKTYISPFTIFLNATVGNAQLAVPVAGVIDNLYTGCNLNNNTADLVVTLNVNGSDTALTATIPASTTGDFDDLTHKISVSQGDLISFSLSEATTGVNGNGFISARFTASGSSPVPGIPSVASITLTSAQIKALHATPITIVPAPGMGKIVMPLQVLFNLNYGGTNAFTNPGGSNIFLYYTDASSTSNACSTSGLSDVQITSTASQIGFTPGASQTTDSVAINAPVVVSQPSAMEIAGNAAGDNTIDVTVYYYTITL